MANCLPAIINVHAAFIMSNNIFGDTDLPVQIVSATLVSPPRRRAAPLAAWFMLTAVMASYCTIVATALSEANSIEDWSSVLLAAFGVGIVSGVLGGLAGLFDQSPLRGGILGAALGAIVGITSACAAIIPHAKIDLAFHSAAVAAICIFAAALMGRWQR